MPLPFRTPQFSASISHQFKPDTIQMYGLADTVSCSYYDPVQSLFIVGTQTGKVYVYGKSGTTCLFNDESRDPVVRVFLSKTVYLVQITQSSRVTVWDLETSEKWASYHIPSPAISHYIDPALDWLFVGQRNGQTSVFDLDRGIISHFLIDNIQLQMIPAARMGAVLSVQIHPRDITQVLLCYSDMFAVFSVTTNTIQFHEKSKDKLKFAKWNPNGTHILTGSEGSLSFWDGYSGRFLSARPSDHTTEPIWCSTDNLDDTFLMYGAGSQLVKVPFGITPTYSVTSWDAFGKFFGNAKTLTYSFDHDVAEITPIVASPFYGGGHNPRCFAIRLVDQTWHTLKTNLKPAILSAILPEALAFSANKITSTYLASVPRLTWSGMMMSALPPVLRGGSLASTTARLNNTSVTVCGYVDGSIRFFSEATSDETRVMETSVAQAAPGPITHISLCENASEMAVAVFSGVVVLLGYQKNNLNLDSLKLKNPEIRSVSHTANQDIKEGFIPLWEILPRGNETVTALRQADVGFAGIGYSSGRITVVDKRGPAFILDEMLPSPASCISFGIQELQEDGYSSVLMSVGTANGLVILYKIVPRPQGGFQAVRATEYSLGSGPVNSLTHLNLGSGSQAVASRDIMSQLARGIRIDGGLLAVSAEDARIFGVTGTKPKISHKRLDRCIGAGFACLREGDALGLITVNQKGKMAAYGIPTLSSLFGYELPQFPVGQCHISQSGNILVPLTDRMSCLIRIWGIGQHIQNDRVYTASFKMEHRPEISGVEWVSGRQYVKVSDFDHLMSGDRRPKPRKERDLFATAAPASPRALAPSQKRGWFEQAHPTSYASAMPTQSKTWGQTFESYYDSAADAVNGAMDDAIENINATKKDATKGLVKGVIRSKFGF